MSQSKKESPRCLLKREKDDINGAANSPEAKRLETQGSSSNKDDNKKQDDSTVTMPAIEAMMRRMMSTMRQDIKDDLETTVTGIKDNIDTLQNDVSNNTAAISTIHTRLDKLEHQQRQPTTTAQPSTSRDDDTSRQRQVIVSGFDYDSPADSIIATINKFLDVNNRRTNVTDVSTFSDPSAIGVITFKTVAAKIGFYKSIRNCSDSDKELSNDKAMRFKDNMTTTECAQSKRLGQVKHRLSLKGGIAADRIKIHWKDGIVKYKGKQIFGINDAGQYHYNDEATLVQEDVETFMKTWADKRGLDQSE